MKQTLKRTLILVLAMCLVLGTGITQTFASEKHPEAIKDSSSNFGYDFVLTFNDSDASWLKAITSISVSDENYEKASSSFSVWNNKCYYVDEASNKVYIGEGGTFTSGKAICKIKANGYDDLTIELNKSDHSAVIKADESTGGDGEKEDGKEEETVKAAPTITVSQANYYVIFGSDAQGYAAGISSIKVGDVSLTKQTSKMALNGKQYYIDEESNEIYFDEFGTRPFKSGDIITISNPAYEDVKLKVSISGNTVSISKAEDGEAEEDKYELHVRLKGSFESAVINQKGYDAVSGASTNVTENKNSDAYVEAALIEKGKTVEESDWKLLSSFEEGNKINVDTKNTSINMYMEGTEENESGMTPVYSTYDGSITLSGTPKKAGKYKVSVTLVDDQGRKATSNELNFTIYTGEEYLEEQLVLDNCTKTDDGKYMYDMIPWTIKNFDNNDNTVRIPADIKAWYGSHTSGTYGLLGYAVKSGSDTTQTLIVPKDCKITIVNMEMLSSVRIVVEEGGTLILRDSVVSGIIDVKSGGTLSVDYDDYSGKFLTGSSISGQIIMRDGSTLENARIKSNTNYLANGDEARQNDNPVVVTEGNVTIKGQVFIKGDEAGTYSEGQKGLAVTNGTLTLENGSVLAVFGGGSTPLTTNGGNAITLDNGQITGAGKLIAVAGAGSLGTNNKGGNGISGNGSISVKDVYAEGGAVKFSDNGIAGKAIADTVKLSGNSNRNLIDGADIKSNAEDIDRGTMWDGVDLTPDLSKYPVDENAPGEKEENDNSDNNASGNTGDNTENNTGSNTSDGINNNTSENQGENNNSSEEVAENTGAATGEENKEENKEEKNPKTGDETDLIMLLTIAGLSISGLAYGIRRRKLF